MSDLPDISPLVLYGKKSWRWFVRLLGKAARNRTFRRSYAIGAVAVLLLATVLWAVLGARLQAHNADQLSDPYMFANWATFHGATFPGSHTFLLKWPIFWLVSVFGMSSASLLTATVAVVLLTVAVLTIILYKIDRRPLVFGTVCLSLALALLLIPAQPYAGGILPVNMAMLTTRNLEYAVYLGVLVLLARTSRLRSRSFAAGTLLLVLLIASDKLFASLSLGGALLVLIVYALVSNWSLTSFAARWLAGSIIATVGSTVVLFIISAAHLTHLTSSTAGSPYALVHSAKSVMLGLAYAALGLFTNGGANPAYDNKVLSQLPGNIAHRLWSFGGLAYLSAAAGLLFALVLAWRLLWPTFKAAPRRTQLPTANLLALSLIWSTVAALGVFVVTNHYYAVDARYLTIGVFALAVSASVGLRKMHWQWPEDLLIISCGLLIVIGLAAATALHTASQQTAALDTVGHRNSLINEALKIHKVDVLVGDYWRVLPIKLASHGTQNVLPLGTCTQPTAALTSSTWQPDLTKHSFAYLVTLDSSLTGFPKCSLPDVTLKYGRPNATQIIAGTLAHPTEALLFYDQGSHKPITQKDAATHSPILPVGLQELTDTSCDQPTIMNVVAHEDDDLLFMSPDLLHELQGGNCVRTVYLTAGDAGSGKYYWVGRQLGAEAAYSEMLGIKNIWNQQTVTLAPGEYVTVATPHGSAKVSLIFFNLPDGNLRGQGFAGFGYQSLAKLHSGSIVSLQTVDGQSTYSSDSLAAALAMFMNTYQPATVHTQADVASASYPDHSDHITTGLYAEEAALGYDEQHFGNALSIPVVRYIGYPVHGYSDNVSGDDLDKKVASFSAYAQYDGGVCRTLTLCARDTTYGFYLKRQYQQ